MWFMVSKRKYYKMMRCKNDDIELKKKYIEKLESDIRVLLKELRRLINNGALELPSNGDQQQDPAVGKLYTTFII